MKTASLCVQNSVRRREQIKEERPKNKININNANNKYKNRNYNDKKQHKIAKV